MDLLRYKRNLKRLQKRLYDIAWGTERPERELFHYTSREGFEGILSSGKVRAADVRYLADPEEISYASQLIEPMFRKSVGTLSERARAFLAPFDPKSYRLRDHFPVYAFSLTELEDDERLWREYARHGSGYALGMLFSESVDDRIQRVIYSRRDQRAVVREILNESVKFLSAVLSRPVAVDTDEEGKELACEFLVTLQKALAMCAPRFKREAYSFEGEWRFLGVGDPPEGDNNGKPFVEFKLEELDPVSPDGLHSVCIGPRADGQEAFVEGVLTAAGLANVEIRRSRFQR